MTRTVSQTVVFAFALAIAAMWPLVSSAANTATLLGTVADASGAVVPGASVNVRNIDTNYERDEVTDREGNYRISTLPVGKYELRVQMQKFRTFVRSGIILTVEQEARVNVALEIGAVAENLKIVGNAPDLDTENSTVGHLLENAQIVELPLNGRNFIQLATLGSGVAVSGGGGATPGGGAEGGATNSFSANGQRSQSNNFVLDGTDNNDPFFGMMNVVPSIDAIQEFRIETNNYSAEYGAKGGAVVTVVTKSGTNNFHGSAYEFFRNSVLDARNYFDVPGLSKPGFVYNQFGGTFGGPIRKDRTFFFGGYEGFRLGAHETQFTNVPSLDQRNGIFVEPVVTANGTVIQTVQVPVDPVAAKLFSVWPLPNSTSSAGNFFSSPKTTNNSDSALVKIDQRLGDSDTLMGRYSYQKDDRFDPLSGSSQNRATIPGFGFIQPLRSHVLTTSFTHIFNPRVINEFWFGFNRSSFVREGENGPLASDFGFNLNRPAELNQNLMPSIIVGAALTGVVSNLGESAIVPQSATTNTWQIADNVTFRKGRHSFNTGGEVRRYSSDRFFPVSEGGFIQFTGARAGIANPSLRNSFDPLLDFALGLPTVAFTFDGDAHRSYGYTAYNAYFQDSIAVSRKLVVNLGVRYEYNTVLTEAKGKLQEWFPSMINTPTLGLFIVGNNTAACAIPCASLNGLTGPYKPDRLDFAPRVGIAYSLNDSTVLRAGYGIFYDSTNLRFITDVMLGPPFLNNFVNVFPSWPDSFGLGKSFGGTVALHPPIRITSFANDFRFPYSQQWDLSLQRLLSKNVNLELAYVGTVARHLTFNNDLNQPIIDPAVWGRPLTSKDSGTEDARRPYHGVSMTNIFGSGDNSSYHSLQAKLTHRLSRGLTSNVAYTWSKSIDEGSELEDTLATNNVHRPQDANNRLGDRGPSDFDLTHRFTLSLVYSIPTLRNLFSGLPPRLADGWQTSGIVVAQSGNPYTILTGLDRSLTGGGADRPNVIGDPNAGPQTVSRWFNTSAFALNNLGHFGNAGRNILRGPRYVNFDFSVAKNIATFSEHSLQLRMEIFNVLNTPHFSLPSNVMAAPNYGSIYETIDVAQGNVGLGSGGPRLIQFGVKYVF